VKFHPWRYIYYVAIALIGAVTLIVYATFPETAYNRNRESTGTFTTLTSSGGRVRRSTKGEEAGTAEIHEVVTTETVNSNGGWIKGLKLYHGKYTETIWQMTIRPVGLLILPPVLWATLVMSVTIGFITAITSNVASAFSETWIRGMAVWSLFLFCYCRMLLWYHPWWPLV
jgi:hypothetical protein